MASMLLSPEEVVSSVLNDDTKSYGKRFLLDDKEDTCWNSDHGLPQSIIIEFKSQVVLKELKLMFQGGFVGIDCEICLESDGKMASVFSFFPEDVNDLQSFPLPSHLTVESGTRLNLIFKQSSDFYGRVTVYQIQFYGNN